MEFILGYLETAKRILYTQRNDSQYLMAVSQCMTPAAEGVQSTSAGHLIIYNELNGGLTVINRWLNLAGIIGAAVM